MTENLLNDINNMKETSLLIGPSFHFMQVRFIIVFKINEILWYNWKKLYKSSRENLSAK